MNEQERKPYYGPRRRRLCAVTAYTGLVAIIAAVYGLAAHNTPIRVCGALVAMACVTIVALLLDPSE